MSSYKKLLLEIPLGNAAHSHLLAALAIALVVAGCGTKQSNTTYPASGVVVWADGQPAKELVGATVSFKAYEGPTGTVFSTGGVNADGTFTMKTYQPDDGAPAGKYYVAVIPGIIRDNQARPMTNAMDLRFQNYETSSLNVEVKPEPNVFKLTVERASKR